jgi:hypothetical protein
MPETTSLLDELLSKLIAEDTGILPEEVTLEFIRKMRKRMYEDSQFQLDMSSESQRDPSVSVPTAAKAEQWNKKCCKWAQEILQQVSTAR